MFNGIGRLEREAFFGGIEHNSAVSRFKLDVGNPPGPFPRNTPSFSNHGFFIRLTALEQLLSSVCRSAIRIPAERMSLKPDDTPLFYNRHFETTWIL